MGEVMIYRLLKNYFNAEEFHMKETIPNYKWCLCMIRFPSSSFQVLSDIFFNSRIGKIEDFLPNVSHA
jgi:hypothetical protein